MIDNLAAKVQKYFGNKVFEAKNCKKESKSLEDKRKMPIFATVN